MAYSNYAPELYDYFSAAPTGFGPSLPSIGGSAAPILEPKVYYSNGFLPAGGGQVTFGSMIKSTLGGLIDTLAGGIAGHIQPMSMGGVPARVPAPVSAPVGGGTLQRIGSTMGAHPVITSIGGAAAVGAAALGMGMAPGIGGHRARYAAPGTKGYHMIKKGPHAGLWTRNRHRNVANVRALRRSISRLHGFERICRKVLHFTKPHGVRGRAVFRRRRRK